MKILHNEAAGLDIFPFFHAKYVFSNWHQGLLEIRSRRYTCVEQYMMHQKAMMFGDFDAAKRIMASADPAVHKSEGRGVRGFNEQAWTTAAPAFIREALLMKFTQSKTAYDALMATGPALLVEASPYDKIWGAGLGMDDARLTTVHPRDWPGQNKLGNLLSSLKVSLENAAIFSKPSTLF